MESQYRLLVSHGRCRVSEEWKIIEICKYMGWDYNTYMAQPVLFLRLIEIKMNVDAEQQKRDARRAEQQKRLGKT